MKKIVLSSILIVAALACSAQRKTKPSAINSKPKIAAIDTSKNKNFTPSAEKLFHVDIKYNDLVIFLNSAATGFPAWLKTTSTAMNKEKDANKQFVDIYNNITHQVDIQRKADSVMAAKRDTIKTK